MSPWVIKNLYTRFGSRKWHHNLDEIFHHSLEAKHLILVWIMKVKGPKNQADFIEVIWHVSWENRPLRGSEHCYTWAVMVNLVICKTLEATLGSNLTPKPFSVSFFRGPITKVNNALFFSLAPRLHVVAIMAGVCGKHFFFKWHFLSRSAVFLLRVQIIMSCTECPFGIKGNWIKLLLVLYLTNNNPSSYSSWNYSTGLMGSSNKQNKKGSSFNLYQIYLMWLAPGIYKNPTKYHHLLLGPPPLLLFSRMNTSGHFLLCRVNMTWHSWYNWLTF